MPNVNISRGAFRVWVVLTLLWLALIAAFAWAEITNATGGRWQYAPELKDEVKIGSEDRRPLSEMFKLPSQAKWPADFSKVDYKYQSGFEEAVKDGREVLVDFPDGSSLYLYTFFGKTEQELVGRWFWEKRWHRRFEALTNQGPLLAAALIPPLLLLALWFTARWVFAGFRGT